MAADLPVLGSFTKAQCHNQSLREARDGKAEEESLTMMVRGDVIRDCEESTLTEVFSMIAPVKSARIIKDRELKNKYFDRNFSIF